jgi:hypothetical protein
MQLIKKHLHVAAAVSQWPWWNGSVAGWRQWAALAAQSPVPVGTAWVLLFPQKQLHRVPARPGWTRSWRGEETRQAFCGVEKVCCFSLGKQPERWKRIYIKLWKAFLSNWSGFLIWDYLYVKWIYICNKNILLFIHSDGTWEEADAISRCKLCRTRGT